MIFGFFFFFGTMKSIYGQPDSNPNGPKKEEEVFQNSSTPTTSMSSLDPKNEYPYEELKTFSSKDIGIEDLKVSDFEQTEAKTKIGPPPIITKSHADDAELGMSNQ